MTTQPPPWWPVTVTWTSTPGIPGDRIVDAVRARTADQARQAAADNWLAAHITVNTRETHVSDYDTYVGQVTGPDGTPYDVDVHPGKRDTVIVTGPGGAEHEVDANASKHGSDEPIGPHVIRRHVCFIPECSTPGCDAWDDAEYTPHFDSDEEAIARLVDEWGWTNDGALLCPADSARRQCEQTGHDWYDPSLEDPRFERKYCRNCPETRPIRDTATA